MAAAQRKSARARRRLRPATQRPDARPDTGLALMLARQGTTRLSADAQRLHQHAQVAAGDLELVLLEARLGQQQTRALTERLRPLTRSRDMAVRFEAQELLVALERVAGMIESSIKRLTPPQPRNARQIAAALGARLR